MNPHQKNKVDISSLSPDEQRLFKLYGKLPSKKDLLQNKLKERKYFDSGDYALSKAGKASDVGATQIGREHPVPEKIPHLSTSPSSGNSNILGASPNTAFPPPNGLHTVGGQSGSPVKEGSFLSREQSIDDQPGEEEVDSSAKNGNNTKAEENLPRGKISPPPVREGVPIRVARP